MTHSPFSRPQTVPPPSLPPPSGSHGSREKSTVPPLPVTNSYSVDLTKSQSTLWYRTTKGIVFIIVIASVVVGAVVGVAVGVTQSKQKGNSTPTEHASTGIAAPTVAETTQSSRGGLVSFTNVPLPTSSNAVPISSEVDQSINNNGDGNAASL